jgi:hypothetical protein
MKQITCPGRFYRGNTLVITPATKDYYGEKTGVCDWCGQRVNLRYTGEPHTHQVWVTIHEANEPIGSTK